jgi:hypothetical protein
MINLRRDLKVILLDEFSGLREPTLHAKPANPARIGIQYPFRLILPNTFLILPLLMHQNHLTNIVGLKEINPIYGLER